jgi:leucyl/phenylalanyl-tRNA--protein transferase
MRAAYLKLHRLGFAHSVETWEGERLVGGLYGVALGAVFFGESMFSIERDASKVALGRLCKELLARDFRMIDCQMATPHLLSLGARLIPRPSFIETLGGHVGDEPEPQRWVDATPASADSDSAT